MTPLRPRVLLIEDDAMTAKGLLRLMQRRYPHAVFGHAATMADAEQLAEARNGAAPSVIITDGNYPTQHGGPMRHQVDAALRLAQAVKAELICYVGDVGQIKDATRQALAAHGAQIAEKPDVRGLETALGRALGRP